MHQRANQNGADPADQSMAGKHFAQGNPALNGMASYEQSCIFFGNIPYDAEDAEL